MSDKMTFNAASTVLVINVNPPTDSVSGKRGVSTATVTPPTTVPEPLGQPGDTEAEQPVIGEATHKKNRIQELETHLPGDVLAVIEPPPDADELKADEEASKPESDLPKPPCATEKPPPANLEGHADPLALQVGFFGDIPRWRPGSIINFATYAGGYPSAADASYASNALGIAANEWNRNYIGVTFRWVNRLEDAAFVLGYGGDKGGVLAEAFFPNGNDLNNVLVYAGAFSSDWKPHMWNVFVHELGHVLGLRHEFAMDKDVYGRVREGGSVQFGPRDEFSVMNYRNEPPRLTAQDIQGTRQFYAYPGGSISGMQIKDWIPDN